MVKEAKVRGGKRRKEGKKREQRIYREDGERGDLKRRWDKRGEKT